MSGHSKWSTIKHKKALEDSKKGKAFGEVSRMIRVAVKEGRSGDASMNPALRVALEKARSVNMPKDNVQRAIDKGLGKSKAGVIFEEVRYEGYGPGGVGFMVFAITDNRNRTGAEVRLAFDRSGGSLGGPGSTAYLFDIQSSGGVEVKVPMEVPDSEVRAQLEKLIDSLESHDDVEQVVTNLV